MKPYYYIYNAATGMLEEFKSEDIFDAIFCSENLAKLYPGTPFEILQCVGISHVSATKTSWIDGFSPKTKEVKK